MELDVKSGGSFELEEEMALEFESSWINHDTSNHDTSNNKLEEEVEVYNLVVLQLQAMTFETPSNMRNLKDLATQKDGVISPSYTE